MCTVIRRVAYLVSDFSSFGFFGFQTEISIHIRMSLAQPYLQYREGGKHPSLGQTVASLMMYVTQTWDVYFHTLIWWKLILPSEACGKVAPPAPCCHHAQLPPPPLEQANRSLGAQVSSVQSPTFTLSSAFGGWLLWLISGLGITKSPTLFQEQNFKDDVTRFPYLLRNVTRLGWFWHMTCKSVSTRMKWQVHVTACCFEVHLAWDARKI